MARLCDQEMRPIAADDGRALSPRYTVGLTGCVRSPAHNDWAWRCGPDQLHVEDLSTRLLRESTAPMEWVVTPPLLLGAEGIFC